MVGASAVLVWIIRRTLLGRLEVGEFDVGVRRAREMVRVEKSHLSHIVDLMNLVHKVHLATLVHLEDAETPAAAIRREWPSGCRT